MFMTASNLMNCESSINNFNRLKMPALKSSNSKFNVAPLRPRPRNLITCLWEPGLCGGPDAPGNATRGDPGNPPTPEKPPPLSALQQSPLVRLSFRTSSGANTSNRSTAQSWDAVLLGRVLYVALPSNPAESSKEAFVALLEAAEERLNCRHVILVFPSDRPDRASLIRTFMFLGFGVLSPNSQLVPPQLANGNVCMLYNIDE